MAHLVYGHVYVYPLSPNPTGLDEMPLLTVRLEQDLLEYPPYCLGSTGFVTLRNVLIQASGSMLWLTEIWPLKLDISLEAVALYWTREQNRVNPANPFPLERKFESEVNKALANTLVQAPLDTDSISQQGKGVEVVISPAGNTLGLNAGISDRLISTYLRNSEGRLFHHVPWVF